jgi:hypothetical protein
MVTVLPDSLAWLMLVVAAGKPFVVLKLTTAVPGVDVLTANVAP